MPRAVVTAATEHLERDLPVEPEVLGQVDLAHASAAEALQDAVVGGGLADDGSLLPLIIGGAAGQE